MPMDTLIIIRKIREAEVLAEQGRHGEARKWLEPLLDDKGLSDNQRSLLSKKIDLFDKQHDRATRMMSRRSLEQQTSRGDSTRGQTTVSDAPKPAAHESSGDTTVPGMKAVAAVNPTEVVPKPPPAPTAVANTPQPRSSSDTDVEDDATARPGPPPASTPRRPTAVIRQALGKSSAELRQVAAQLPENDISRDLAFEVARLKDEVARLASTRAQRASADRADSAAVIPPRDANAPELEVLRRDTVRRATGEVKADTAASPGEAAASVPPADNMRQLAVVLAILVIAGLVSYGAWWMFSALSPPTPRNVTLTEAAVGALRLGHDYKGNPAVKRPLLRHGMVIDEDSGWRVQLDARDNVTAVAVPVDGKAVIHVRFERHDLSPLGAVDAKTVMDKFGEPVRPYDPELFAKSDWGVLRYESRQGASAVDFIFKGADKSYRLAWIRLVDLKADPPMPDLGP